MIRWMKGFKGRSPFSVNIATQGLGKGGGGYHPSGWELTLVFTMKETLFYQATCELALR